MTVKVFDTHYFRLTSDNRHHYEIQAYLSQAGRGRSVLTQKTDLNTGGNLGCGSAGRSYR